MKATAIRKDLTVEKIAAQNPHINAPLFREWQKKMAVIERAGIAHPERVNPTPKRRQSIPLSVLKF